MKRGLHFVLKVSWLYLGFVLCTRAVQADDVPTMLELNGNLTLPESCNVTELTEAARSLLRDLEPVTVVHSVCDACSCPTTESECLELQASRARAREQRLSRIEAVVAQCERVLAEAAK